MTIHLHIDRLIVDGLNLDQSIAGDLRAALESRLTELFSDHATQSSLAAGLTVPRFGTISLSPAVTGASLGASTAEALHAGLTGPHDTSRVAGGPARGR